MPLDPKLLEILACPVCKESVQALPDDGGLACPKCRRVYPIEEGIPVMMIDRAVIPSG